MAKNYLNIDLPPGMFSNGTEYSNRGRWTDGSRVRWQNGAIRPIGGWVPFGVAEGTLDRLITNPSVELARAITCWRANDGTSLYAVGTNRRLLAWGRAVTTVYNITPDDFEPRPAEVFASNGYGDWFYNLDAYGTPRPVDEDTVGTFTWTLRLWGQNLLAAPRGAPSKLYEWFPSFTGKAQPVANAPENFDCFHVTDQRIVMCAGSPDEPRMVRWSDRENNTIWAPTEQNMAGFQVVPGIGKFLNIVTVQDQYVLVSETDAHVCRYIGAPFVYGFDQIGDRCGAISPQSIVTVDAFAMWPGVNSFFVCDGNSVQRIDCPVLDKMANAIDGSQRTKTQGFVNPFWPEIWWLYQDGDDDIDSYISYDYVAKTWSHGRLDRLVGGGYAATGGLVMIDSQGFAFLHEQAGTVPLDDDEHPSAIFVRTGPIELPGTSGGTTQFVRALQPDFEAEGVVNVTLIGRDRPGAPEIPFGPYRVASPSPSRQPIPTRARGHSISVLVEGSQSMWKLGSMRLDLAAGGEK